MKIINVRFSNADYMRTPVELPTAITVIGANYNSWSLETTYGLDVWADENSPRRKYEFRIITSHSELEGSGWVVPVPVIGSPMEQYVTWRYVE